tara:strand:+ start:453 stop:617 length:165 start_codon:yes stop_codon:yes gene_type:complete
MYGFIKKKFFKREPKTYEVSIPKDIEGEILKTLRELNLSEREIREAVSSFNIRK